MDYPIRPLFPADLPEALTLVWAVFSEFEAPDYSEEGIAEFKSYIRAEDLAPQMEQGKLRMWGAFSGGKLVGALAGGPCGHIHLLFVQGAFHRRGIAKALFHAYAGQLPPGTRLTVNSSPYAVEAYRRLGYAATGPEQTVNGLRFLPMEQALPA